MKSVPATTFQLQKSLQAVDTMKEKQLQAAAENKKMEDACKDFEAILLNQLLSAMRESIPEGGLFEKSHGEKIYQSMLDEEMTRQMAHGKGMGFARMLYQQLSSRSDTPGGE